jgi:parvulin-like peptidyl-prolyl isomerase
MSTPFSWIILADLLRLLYLFSYHARGLRMSSQDLIIASLPETQLTLGGLLEWLRTQGRLAPLVREALAAQLVREQARKADLSVTAQELQAAVDHWRRRHGLYSAADTQAWLAAQGLSVDDFEARLEQDILAAKLRSHLTGAEVDGHFTAHQADFDRLRLALVLVPREDLARELASQVREEGRDLADVAREQGLHLERGEKLRKELKGPLGTALRSAEVGQLVGPVGTPQGFALVVIEECHPAKLDGATRQRIQDELFEGWLAARLREATLNLSPAGVS